MPFGVKSLEKRQNDLVRKLFPESAGNVNATRLVVRALQLHVLDSLSFGIRRGAPLFFVYILLIQFYESLRFVFG